MNADALTAMDSRPGARQRAGGMHGVQGAAKGTRLLARAALAAAGVLVSASVLAQEMQINGLGWLQARPGSQVSGQTRVEVSGNRATAPVTATGGKASVGAGIVGRAQLIATAQANSAGLGSVDARSSQLNVVNNELADFVNATGGAATANVALFSGGDTRRALHGTRFDLVTNQAGAVQATGGSADVLLGAVGSLQLPGRATANSILFDGGDARHLQAALVENRAHDVVSLGGAALANAFTVAGSNLSQSRVFVAGNRSEHVRAAGGSGGLGANLLLQADLTGAALAGSVVIADSDLRDLWVSSTGNQAQEVQGLGGTAIANSVNVDGARGGRFDLRQRENQAADVIARGGQGSVLAGALADVSQSATALANSISIQGAGAADVHEYVQLGNRAERLRADGGGAAANSIWLQQASVQGSDVVMLDNTVRDVSVSAIAASAGGGVLGSFQRIGRALANSVVLGPGAAASNSPALLGSNEAQALHADGGLVAANSVLVDDGGQLVSAPVNLMDNQSREQAATGFDGGAGFGLLASASQKALALANSVVIFGSEVMAALTLRGNRSSAMDSGGGKALANSISVERGDRGASRLAAPVLVAENHAGHVRTGARSGAGPLHTFSSHMAARAAANALVLSDGAVLDDGAALTLANNRATWLDAVGGTVLVNSVAAYRGARISGAPLILSDNDARDIGAGGHSGQAVGVGRSSNGVVAVNSVYLDGGEVGAIELSGTPVVLKANHATDVRARGGRINVNALAVNGGGSMRSSAYSVQGNRAQNVSSQGSEGTVAGHAVTGGVGTANANALQTRGPVDTSTVTLADNLARDVSAGQGLAVANSVVTDGGIAHSTIALVGNEAKEVDAGGATALANGVRVDKSGQLIDSSIAVVRNRGTVVGGGTANSVDVRRNAVAGSRITLLGNQAHVSDGGLANSVRSDNVISSSRIRIANNQATVRNGGTVNSVENHGPMKQVRIDIVGNEGRAQGGGVVNSVENHGQLSGRIAIMNNVGKAVGGGTVNSVVNRGVFSGDVVISGNRGVVGAGGTANSVINDGVLAGKVAIVGHAAGAMAGGALAGVASRGPVQAASGSVVSNSVTIVQGVNSVRM